METMSKKMAIGLVLVTKTLDSSNAVYGAVKNFLDIYDAISDNFIIFGPIFSSFSHAELISVPRWNLGTGIGNIFSYILYQFGLAKALFLYRRQCDVVFFHIGGALLILPLLCCKICGIPTAVFVTGSIKQSYLSQTSKGFANRVIGKVICFIERICYTLTECVIALSTNMLYSGCIDADSQKVRVANLNYIDPEKFQRVKSFYERSIDLIFVGRFEKVKAIDNFVYSLPFIFEKFPNLKVELVGDGSLKKKLEDFVKSHGLTERVNFCGWIDHIYLPDKLNDARFLVMPSESEGLPKTLLEAMACGVIPIVTAVGGIPDIVEDETTGFTLKENSPRHIAENVVGALNHLDIEQISQEGAYLIKKEFNYDKTVEVYKQIIEEIER